MRALLLVALIATTTPAVAAPLTESQQFYCNIAAANAALIARMRQNGAPLAENLAIMTRHWGDDPWMDAAIEHFLERAYAMPRVDNKEEKDRIVADLRDEGFLRCFRAVNG